ncbi:MAG TPA: c-type cytochrome [Beijerinckiaceae bacterium]|jgi:mono/diheme cytochrome c family protein|nr:c-type cytochrome [Beijerinckiaceae bacterium]
MNRTLLKTAIAVSALVGGAAFAQQPVPQGSAEAGKLTFNKACYTCHGTTGQGAAPTGPRIGPTALPFDAFIHQVRDPRSQMVPFPPNILSDQDVADIYAYLQSQKKEDYKQIPLLSQSQ